MRTRCKRAFGAERVLCPRAFCLRGLGFGAALRGPDDESDDRAAEHDRGDDVEGERVAIGGVEDAGEQE